MAFSLPAAFILEFFPKSASPGSWRGRIRLRTASGPGSKANVHWHSESLARHASEVDVGYGCVRAAKVLVIECIVSNNARFQAHAFPDTKIAGYGDITPFMPI